MQKTDEKMAPNQETVLVVDDEREVCQLLRRILHREHLRVLCATSGRMALATLKHNTVDLVILDICMPGLSGIRVLKIIRSRLNDLPVLMLTAHGHVATARQAMRLGAYDYLTKPFKVKFILDIVHEALQTRNFLRASE